MTECSVPDWWPGLTAERLGVDWLDPADWEPAWQHVEESGTASREHRDLDDELLRKGKLLVGTGPGTVRRWTGQRLAAAWYFDPSEPGLLWCALGGFYPAWLWIPLRPTAAGVRAALGAPFPARPAPRAELTGFVRGFLGALHQVTVPYVPVEDPSWAAVPTGELVPLDGGALDRYMKTVKFADPQPWGGAREEDPYPEELPWDAGHLTDFLPVRDGHRMQRLGRVPSMTWRTLHSRSHLSVEIHTREVVCAAVRYRPSPESHRAVVRRVNEVHGDRFPEDLPLDAVGVLAGWEFDVEDDLYHHLDDPDADTAGFALRCLAALRHGDLRRTLELREWAAHPDPAVRADLVLLAHSYDHRFLLQELALAETDPDELARLEDLLDRAPGPDAFNAFRDDFGGAPVMVDESGVPVDTWDDDEEDV
ncbi:hypothetical protein ACFOY4_27305 [Actinomadura syzygii]|uniref:Uncharacterized protein n=1 Tax=Actinomadura syzygii TaxID=1427538 RepID=A0A5D0UIC2_9ACTN|nr:hypothetical protein [Actinomadura syzygii]TYC17343.1 hypothetical protein FXF65_04825 [Actinomadura syzygii]